MARLSFVLAAVLCVTAVSAKCPNDVDWVEGGVKICSKIHCPAIDLDCEKVEEDLSYDITLDVTLVGCPVCKDKKQLRALSGSNDRHSCPPDYPIEKYPGWCAATNCELPPYCELSMDRFFPKFTYRNGLKLQECPSCSKKFKVVDGCPDNGFQFKKVSMSEDGRKNRKFRVGKRNGRTNEEIREAAEQAGYYCMPKQCRRVHRHCEAGASAGAEKVRKFINSPPIVFKGCTHCNNKNAVDDPHWGGF